MGLLGKILNKNTPAGIAESGVELLKQGKNLIDEAFTSKEEKAQAYQRLMDAVLVDKQSAREMYKVDNWLQKVFAIVFLVAYFILLGLIVHLIFKMANGTTDFPEWAIALLSTILGGMSSKVNTIVDFLFGGSQDGSVLQNIFNKKNNKNG